MMMFKKSNKNFKNRRGELMKYKFLIIGGSRGIGHDIALHFKGDSVSRTNGYNIKNPESRRKIAEKSLDYDVVVNHAYCGDFSQMEMLKELYLLWRDKEKKGYIINTGSTASYRFDNRKDEKWWFLASMKKGLDEFINYLSHAATWRGEVDFRITNIRPGLLDTEQSREKPYFKSGIRGKDYCHLIEYLLSTPEDLIISELVMESKCPQ